jgi:hypothetical protein
MPKAPALLYLAILLGLPFWPLAASAEVVSIAANGFVVRDTTEIAAAPDQVYLFTLDNAGIFQVCFLEEPINQFFGHDSSAASG